MKFKDLAQLSTEERKIKKRELELELIKLNTQVATGTPPKNAGTVSRIKKDIARLMLIERLSGVGVRKTAGEASAGGVSQSTGTEYSSTVIKSGNKKTIAKKKLAGTKTKK